MGVQTGQGGEILFQELVGPYDEVTLLVAFYGDVGDFQVAVYIGGEVGVHGADLQHVVNGHGIEHGLQVVVAVRTTFHNVESEIDFCCRIGDHVG